MKRVLPLVLLALVTAGCVTGSETPTIWTGPSPTPSPVPAGTWQALPQPQPDTTPLAAAATGGSYYLLSLAGECEVTFARYRDGVWTQLAKPPVEVCGPMSWLEFGGGLLLIQDTTYSDCPIPRFLPGTGKWDCVDDAYESERIWPLDGLFHSTGDSLIAVQAWGPDFSYYSLAATGDAWEPHTVKLSRWGDSDDVTLVVRSGLGLLLPFDEAGGRAVLVDLAAASEVGNLPYQVPDFTTAIGVCDSASDFAGAMWDGKVPVTCGIEPRILDLRTRQTTTVEPPEGSCDVQGLPGFSMYSDDAYRYWVRGCSLYDPATGSWTSPVPSYPGALETDTMVLAAGQDTLLACGQNTKQEAFCLEWRF
jgi:hypothetical protein